MCAPSFKGETQCVESHRPVKPIISGKKRQIEQILHPAVRRASRKRICVNFFCVLLLSGDHLHSRLFDASEAKQVRAFDGFERSDYDIANPGIQMTLGEDPPIHARFDGIARAAIRGSGQSHHWPAFNVADSAICIGIALLFFDMRRKPEEPLAGAGEVA